MEKMFALQCPEEWKVGFVVFYLKGKGQPIVGHCARETA